MQAFFKEHPEYAKNDFFVTGESYAGHYVPAVAGRLHKAQKAKEGVPINLKVGASSMFARWENKRSLLTLLSRTNILWDSCFKNLSHEVIYVISGVRGYHSVPDERMLTWKTLEIKVNAEGCCFSLKCVGVWWLGVGVV